MTATHTWLDALTLGVHAVAADGAPMTERKGLNFADLPLTDDGPSAQTITVTLATPGEVNVHATGAGYVYTLLDTDQIVNVQADSECTCVLPLASLHTGRHVTFRVTPASLYTVALMLTNSDGVLGPLRVLAKLGGGKALELVSDGLAWQPIEGYGDMDDIADRFPALLDYSGQGYHGVLVNETLGDLTRSVPGGSPVGRSIYFSGGYATMGNVLDFECTDPFSVAAWVKTTGTGSVCIMGKSGATNSQGWRLLITGGTTNGRPELYLQGWDGTQGVLAVRTDTTVVNDGGWHLVVATYDGSKTAAGMHVYVNDTEPTPHTAFNTLGSRSITNTGNLNVGAHHDGLTPYAGNMADPAVWNRVLTPTEIREIYNMGTTMDLTAATSAANLRGYWRTTARGWTIAPS